MNTFLHFLQWSAFASILKKTPRLDHPTQWRSAGSFHDGWKGFDIYWGPNWIQVKSGHVRKREKKHPETNSESKAHTNWWVPRWISFWDGTSQSSCTFGAFGWCPSGRTTWHLKPNNIGPDSVIANIPRNMTNLFFVFHSGNLTECFIYTTFRERHLFWSIDETKCAKCEIGLKNVSSNYIDILLHVLRRYYGTRPTSTLLRTSGLPPTIGSWETSLAFGK